MSRSLIVLPRFAELHETIIPRPLFFDSEFPDFCRRSFSLLLNFSPHCFLLRVGHGGVVHGERFDEGIVNVKGVSSHMFWLFVCVVLLRSGRALFSCVVDVCDETLPQVLVSWGVLGAFVVGFLFRPCVLRKNSCVYKFVRLVLLFA